MDFDYLFCSKLKLHAYFFSMKSNQIKSKSKLGLQTSKFLPEIRFGHHCFSFHSIKIDFVCLALLCCLFVLASRNSISVCSSNKQPNSCARIRDSRFITFVPRKSTQIAIIIANSNLEFEFGCSMFDAKSKRLDCNWSYCARS